MLEHARNAARRAIRSDDSTIQFAERLGTADAWYFATAGHGYYAAHVPNLTPALAQALETNEWLVVDTVNGIVAGEEDCAAAVVLWVAKMRGVDLPDHIRASDLLESIERWFPSMIPQIGAAL